MWSKAGRASVSPVAPGKRNTARTQLQLNKTEIEKRTRYRTKPDILSNTTEFRCGVKWVGRRYRKSWPRDGIQMWSEAGRASVSQVAPGNKTPHLTLAKHFKEFGVNTASGEQCAISASLSRGNLQLIGVAATRELERTTNEGGDLHSSSSPGFDRPVFPFEYLGLLPGVQIIGRRLAEWLAIKICQPYGLRFACSEKQMDRSGWTSRKMLKTAEGMGDIVTAKSHCGIWPLYSALGMKRTVAESFGRNVRTKKGVVEHDSTCSTAPFETNNLAPRTRKKTQFQERQAVCGGGSEAAQAAASGKKRKEEQPSQSRDFEHTELQPRCDRSCTIIAGMHRKLPRNCFPEDAAEPERKRSKESGTRQY
ncbi:hypothetical protein B0H14DRAFT_3597808 [Mycena olivaceomarginata]|nr:hypothetical protein B0H14DRAFT_3597808 [Mycena olivaceomarginata]